MKHLIIAAVLAITPSLSSAQTAAVDSIPAVLQQVDSGAMLRIRSQRQTLRGNLVGIGNSGVVIESDAGVPTPIAFNGITDIWKQGNYWKRGAIIGGVTGSAILSAFGFVLLNVACEQEDGCKNDRPTVVLYSIALGGSTGALVGGGLGYLARRWIRIY